MILSKKAKTSDNDETMKSIIREHNNKVMSQPKTIGVQIVEGQDFINEIELGMDTAEVVMMNKAECIHVLSNRTKSTKGKANAVVTYGEYSGGIFVGRPKNHWYVK